MQNEQLAATIERIRDTKVKAFRIFMSANAADSALFFAMIGLIIGWQGWFGVDRTVVSGFVLVLLYVKGPLDQLVGAYGALVNAQVSFRRIARLSADFANPEPHLAEATRSPPLPAPEVASIELRGARYTFPAAQGVEPFTLGPIDLTVRGGEILFIVGENGCGKTTLVKLLLALYPRAGGRASSQWPAGDGGGPRRLSPALLDRVLRLFPVRRPRGAGRGARAPRSADYLARLEIAHKVSITDGRFSTTDLSAGQRKRLALIQVYLEARPVVVFDEWAAEQDPTFRRLFYTQMLPELRRRGRTLIVISHDDRYFAAADRIVRMEAGRIVEIVETNRPADSLHLRNNGPMTELVRDLPAALPHGAARPPPSRTPCSCWTRCRSRCRSAGCSSP